MDTKPLVTELERRAFDARTPIYQLCDRANVSRATFTRWRQGERKPSISLIGKLEAAMDAIEQERRR